jgi:CRISPR system Cascade subunit CasC
VLAEKGDQQPRSLSVAFLKPVNKEHDDYAAQAIKALSVQRDSFNTVYGACADSHYELNALPLQTAGELSELLEFVSV